MYILKITHVLLLLLQRSSPLYESQLTKQRVRPYSQLLDSDPCQNQNIFLLTRKCHNSCPLQLLSVVLRQETNLLLLLLVLLLLLPLSVLQSARVCVCVCVCVLSVFIFQHLSRPWLPEIHARVCVCVFYPCLFFNIYRDPDCRKYTELWNIYWI